MSISVKPPSGTRDFLADDVRRRRQVIETIQAVYERHGFGPLETPTMERLDVLTGKYGDEGDQLMFKVLKRGDKLTNLPENPTQSDLADMGLRYDLTVPLARVFAANQGKLPAFYKRYQIQPVWRADRPQRGRFREFYQCDVDYIGSKSIFAEFDVISAVASALEALKFERFEIRINDRRILSGMLRVAGVANDLHGAALVQIDKLDKIGRDGVLKGLGEAGLDDASVQKLDAMVLTESADPLATVSEALANDEGLAGCDGLRELLTLLEGAGVYGTYRFDPTLARGLSYYTGPIFEIRSPDFSGSLGGGGRYDGLIGMFLKNDVPAVGFSLGVERILVLMEERGAFDEAANACDLVITQLDNACRPAVAKFAVQAREAGLQVHIYPKKTKLGKQLQYADSVGATWAALLGQTEVDEGVVTLKHLKSGDQQRVSVAEAINLLAGGE